MTIPKRTAVKRVSDKRLAANGGKMYSTITGPKKAVKKRPRKPGVTLRTFGTPERRMWVRTLPCAACGVVGYSENAHVAPASEKGTGYRADAKWIAPLCGQHPMNIRPGNYYAAGCHYLFDNEKETFTVRFPDFNAEKAAAQTEQACQDHLKEKGL